MLEYIYSSDQQDWGEMRSFWSRLCGGLLPSLCQLRAKNSRHAFVVEADTPVHLSKCQENIFQYKRVKQQWCLRNDYPLCNFIHPQLLLGSAGGQWTCGTTSGDTNPYPGIWICLLFPHSISVKCRKWRIKRKVFSEIRQRIHWYTYDSIISTIMNSWWYCSLLAARPKQSQIQLN